MAGAFGLAVAVLLASRAADNAALAVYALSFWHYLFYWWAYRYGAVAPTRFRRDAVVMKAMALTAFGVAYLSTPWHLASLLVMIAGFLLNGVAAAALGVERTYYGWELGHVPHVRVTAFPYSVIPHPMLVGNVAAYGGALLNPGFRAAWWPLACLHVGLNAALWLMETVVTPQRHATREPGASHGERHRLPAGPAGALACASGAAALGAALAAAAGWPGRVPYAVVLGGAAAFLVTRAAWYLVPHQAPHRPFPNQEAS